MTIMDELKSIAKRVGITATGNTIMEIVESFKKGLDEKEKMTSGYKTQSVTNDSTTQTKNDYSRSSRS